jgi:hypothetical protein
MIREEAVGIWRKINLSNSAGDSIMLTKRSSVGFAQTTEAADHSDHVGGYPCISGN